MEVCKLIALHFHRLQTHIRIPSQFILSLESVLRILLTLLATLTFIQSSQAQLALDRYMGSFDRDCFGSGLMQQLREGAMPNATLDRWQLPVPVSAPIELLPYFGKPTAEKGEDAVNFHFPMNKTTFFGLPLAGVSILVGMDNGIYGMSFAFRAPMDVVAKAFSKQFAMADKWNKDDDGAPIVFSMRRFDVLTYLNCDAST